MSLVLSMPNEIMLHIASFLRPNDLRTCNTICDQMYMTTGQYNLWSRYFVDMNTIDAPVGRLCHTGVISDGKMYIYGGHITQPSSEYFHTVKQDVFEYDLATRKWLEYSIETAPRRTEHTAVVYNKQMLIFGGYSGSGYENSVMAFDTEQKTWSEFKTTGEAPAARSAHTATIVGSTMFIFGGWNGVQCMNDLYALDLQTAQWRLITPQTAASPRENAQITFCYGTVPTARCSHGAAIVTGNRPGQPAHAMYVFGGYAIEGAAESRDKGYLNDMHMFNFDTLTWSAVPTAGPAPSPRSRFRMISHNENLYLFAGWNSVKHYSSLHRLDTITHQWVEVSTDFTLDGIGQFSLVEHEGIMYVFSGFSPAVGTRTNLFAYPLLPSEILQSP